MFSTCCFMYNRSYNFSYLIFTVHPLPPQVKEIEDEQIPIERGLEKLDLNIEAERAAREKELTLLLD